MHLGAPLPTGLPHVNVILDIGLLSGWFVITVYVIAAIVALLLIVVRPSLRWRRGRWLLTVAVTAVAGALLGVFLTWLLSDTLNLFGAVLTVVARTWIAAGFAGIALALVSLWHATWRRVIGSILALVLFVGTTAMSVNIDFGQYPTVRAALGISVYADDITPFIRPADPSASIATWTAPADMPSAGKVGSVTIPSTTSGFPARKAVVYLPPAALTASPPKLPVIVVLSGQPGTPDDPLLSSKLEQSSNAYAAAHQGLAPIIVSPDQLGAPDRNPLCIDSPAGNSATYITVDVTNWITSTLPVLDGPHYWGIGGLSQGGTCSIQLGAGHPELYGAILDASGEEFPSLGSEQTTIENGFGGDTAAYQAASPAALMAANAPYSDMFAVFGVGSQDASFIPGTQRLYADAQAAGMNATYIEVQGSGHDATTWSSVFAQGLTLIADHWGLDR